MKQRLLGTAAGRFALRLRDRYELLRVALSRPEDLGGVSNDQLAERILTRICLPGRTFVDVGAHIGSIIAAVRHHDPSIRIHAVEAVPEKAAALRTKFPAVQVHGCAVGDQEGEISFFVNTLQSGYSSLGAPTGSDGGASHTREIRVPLRRLDDLVDAADVDVVKIDVEGAELGVLRGAEQLVARCRPTLMFESGPQEENRLGYTKEQMWDWLDAHAYCVLVPNRVAHNDAGLGREGFAESHLYPRRTTNYFAVARERRVELRDRARHVAGIATGS